MALTKITSSVVAVNSLTVANIADNAVDATKIASNSILTRHIDDNQIGIDQLNVSDGSSGQALTTNGSGTLSFATAGETNRLPLAGGTLSGGLSIRGFNGPVLKIGSSGSTDPRIDFEDQDSTDLAAGIFFDQDADTLRMLRTVSGSATDGIAINASGSVLVGKASSGVSSVGAELRSGSSNYALTGTSSSHTTALLNRTTDDGELLQFRKDNSAVGTIGTAGGGAFYVSDALYGGLGFSTLGAGDINPVNTTGAIRDAAADLGQPTARFKDLYLSGGAFIGGTGSANKLDDYEEGTFTPLFYGSSSGTAENSSSGYYTKIGRQVTIHVDVYNKAFGTYSGDLRMQLPFTNAGTSIPSSAGDIYFYPSGNWDGVSNFAGIGLRCYNTSYLTFPLIQLDSDRQTNIGSSNTSTSNSSGNFLRFSFTYVTTT